MSDVAQLFGARADSYARFRPQYPDALFAWLAQQSPTRQCALDIACGNGQAGIPLARYFTRVLGSDSSIEQLRAADTSRIAVFVARAEAQPLADASLDTIVVAQALHWFATPAFFHEAERLLKPRGLFCAWCYGLLRIDSELDTLIDDFYSCTLAGYWPAGRESVDAGYRDIHLPFVALEPPQLAIEANWSLANLLGYLRTWSAVQRWERQHGHDPVMELAPRVSEAWGAINRPRFIRWPLHFLAGRQK